MLSYDNGLCVPPDEKNWIGDVKMLEHVLLCGQIEEYVIRLTMKNFNLVCLLT
jgi:hypothetical protein